MICAINCTLRYNTVWLRKLSTYYTHPSCIKSNAQDVELQKSQFALDPNVRGYLKLQKNIKD